MWLAQAAREQATRRLAAMTTATLQGGGGGEGGAAAAAAGEEGGAVALARRQQQQQQWLVTRRQLLTEVRRHHQPASTLSPLSARHSQPLCFHHGRVQLHATHAHSRAALAAKRTRADAPPQARSLDDRVASLTSQYQACSNEMLQLQREEDRAKNASETLKRMQEVKAGRRRGPGAALPPPRPGAAAGTDDEGDVRSGAATGEEEGWGEEGEGGEEEGRALRALALPLRRDGGAKERRARGPRQQRVHFFSQAEDEALLRAWVRIVVGDGVQAVPSGFKIKKHAW